MAEYYRTLLLEWRDKQIEKATLQKEMEQDTIQELYHQIFSIQAKLEGVRPLLTAKNIIDDSLFAQSLNNIAHQLEIILEFFDEWFETHSFLGSHDAYRNPNVIIVLGCHRPVLDIRIRGAIEYAQDFPDAALVLSGGGFSTASTESSYMKKAFEDSGLKNTLYTEETSMDTIGNALFSKFLLLSQHLLKPNCRIVLITSSFHTVRALNYFKQIFNINQPFPLAAKGIKTQDTGLRKTAAHELISEYQASNHEGVLGSLEAVPHNNQDILLNLFLYHKLYLNRYDILRRYLGVRNED